MILEHHEDVHTCPSSELHLGYQRRSAPPRAPLRTLPTREQKSSRVGGLVTRACVRVTRGSVRRSVRPTGQVAYRSPLRGRRARRRSPQRGDDAYRPLPRSQRRREQRAHSATQTAPLVRNATPTTRMPRSGAAMMPKTKPQVSDTSSSSTAPDRLADVGVGRGAWSDAKRPRGPERAAAPSSPLIHPAAAPGAVSSTRFAAGKQGRHRAPGVRQRGYARGLHGGEKQIWPARGRTRVGRRGTWVGLATAYRDTIASYVSAMTTGRTRATHHPAGGRSA